MPAKRVEKEEKPVLIKEPDFKQEVLDRFLEEFKGLPHVGISVVVRCGHPSAPNYQEVELPMVAELIKAKLGE